MLRLVSARTLTYSDTMGTQLEWKTLGGSGPCVKGPKQRFSCRLGARLSWSSCLLYADIATIAYAVSNRPDGQARFCLLKQENCQAQLRHSCGNHDLLCTPTPLIRQPPEERQRLHEVKANEM